MREYCCTLGAHAYPEPCPLHAPPPRPKDRAHGLNRADRRALARDERRAAWRAR